MTIREPGEGAAPRSYEGTELDLFSHALHWKQYWSDMIRAFVGRHVLDVGSGIGATAACFADVGCDRWLALEPDPALAARIAAAVESGDLPASVHARCGTLRSVDENERFDTILYVDVLEHIDRDAEELELAARHLTPEGFLIIVAPAHNWLYTPFDHAIGHFRRYNADQLRAVMPASLKVVKTWYLDGAGILASIGNRLILRRATPSVLQIRFWDRFLVPVSRALDPLFSYRFGKSVICIAMPAGSASGGRATVALEASRRTERRHAQLGRYVLNGLAATIVHYATLTFMLRVLALPNAGVANFFGALVGIFLSFVGNRYFVFDAHDKPLTQQLARFWALYACIALLHAGVLWLWTDVNGFDYRIGFAIATILQFVLSFLGNKRLVFS